MIRSIVTHPGSAHKDDLLAVAVLVSMHDCPVARRNPTEDELNDPTVATVDIGGRHEPERHNFDHHHFPREHPPTCALSLVLQALDLYDDALQFTDWLETAEWFDSRGPNRTAEWLGVPRLAISRLDSPVDKAVLHAFAKSTAIAPGELLHDVLKLVGNDILSELRGTRARLDALKSQVQRWSLPVGDDVIEALFLPRGGDMSESASDALATYIRAEGLSDVIAAIVYPDRRGRGYGISRHEDHPRLDFCQVADEPDVHFAHVSGFVCKTTATDPERLKTLLRGGWITSAASAAG